MSWIEVLIVGFVIVGSRVVQVLDVLVADYLWGGGYEGEVVFFVLELRKQLFVIIQVYLSAQFRFLPVLNRVISSNF